MVSAELDHHLSPRHETPLAKKAIEEGPRTGKQETQPDTLEVASEAEADVSSIGPTWPPQETSEHRIKGFEVRRIVTDLSQLQDYKELLAQAEAGTLGEYIHRMFNYPAAAKVPEYSRFSFRFLIKTALVRDAVRELGSAVEVVIPLMGSVNFEDTSMVYIGYNKPERQSDPHDLAVAKENVKLALESGPRSFETIINRVLDKGYTLETPTMDARGNDEDLRTQIASLYTRFGKTPEQVHKMLEDQNNILCIARKGDVIVGAGMAELAAIPIQTERGVVVFRFAELTEAATLESYARNGVYTAVCAKEIDELSQLPPDQQIDMALGECNGKAGGVLSAAHTLGRTFAIQDVDLYGGDVKGYLPQHVPISGSERRTANNDLFPAYISHQDIMQFVGKN